MKRKVKITVIRREFYQDLAEKYVARPGVGKCSVFEDGQEFTVTRETYNNFPYENHFCVSAWDVMKHKVYSALQGGNFYWEGWMKNTKELIVCCDDGVRPVVFFLELIEEEG